MYYMNAAATNMNSIVQVCFNVRIFILSLYLVLKYYETMYSRDDKAF